MTAGERPVSGTDKDPARIAGMFDAIAPRYDVLNRVLSAGFDTRWRARAIRALVLSGTETVLDLCTGTADVAIAAVTALPGARRVVGLDFARQMLRLGRDKLLRHGCEGRVDLVQGDAMSLPVASASVDAVTVAFGIRNVARPADTFAEVCRVLRPGGRFVFLEFGLPRLPVIRQAYQAYFRVLLPWVGRVVSGHSSAYAYLPESVRVFPEPDRVVAMLEQTGFVAVRADPLTLGVVYLYSAQKPAC
jgi:demethylmenaquinone methyltransferase / 2-methoxy-6-polyprenyl-1,4-benzoquinol methylase